MMMQTDVKAVERTTTGTVVGGRNRIKGITISYLSGGVVVLRDGGASGTTAWSFTAPVVIGTAGTVNINMPGEGILCVTDIHATLTLATVTVVYG